MTALVRYEAARKALAECKAVDEVKAIRDQAEAMRHYQRMAKNKDLEIDASEIRIRAERRLGELIIAQKDSVGLNKGTIRRGSESEPRDERPTLADSGIDKKLSSRAQKIAAVPESEFERQVGEWREEVSQAGARVTANLEAAGEKAIEGRGRKLKVVGGGKEAADAAAAIAERDELRAVLAETQSQVKELVKDNDAYARSLEDKPDIKAALAEAKRYREENRILQERINGLMGEKAELTRLLKHWKRTAEKLQRGAA